MGSPPYGPWAAVWGSGLLRVGAPWSPFRSQFTAATVLSCSFAVGGLGQGLGSRSGPGEPARGRARPRAPRFWGQLVLPPAGQGHLGLAPPPDLNYTRFRLGGPNHP